MSLNAQAQRRRRLELDEEDDELEEEPDDEEGFDDEDDEDEERLEPVEPNPPRFVEESEVLLGERAEPSALRSEVDDARFLAAAVEEVRFLRLEAALRRRSQDAGSPTSWRRSWSQATVVEVGLGDGVGVGVVAGVVAGSTVWPVEPVEPVEFTGAGARLRAESSEEPHPPSAKPAARARTTTDGRRCMVRNVANLAAARRRAGRRFRPGRVVS